MSNTDTSISSAQASEIIESVSSPGVVQDSLRDANVKVHTQAELSTVESKLATARSKKDTGDAAFKVGDVKSALRSYHETLLYLHGIDKNALKSLGMGGPSSLSAVDQAAGAKDVTTEADIILEKVYANMSACHIKQENWKRAVDTADKALGKNAANSKALFRKAKALGELGFFEKAETALNEIKKVAPNEAPMADAELARQKMMDRERQKVHDQKMRGWLSREKKQVASE
ncbi:uncharacterized protein BJ212DRAFT_1327240 [Suillus subaureus]|uniref:TPR-like protein n=1 Tax=Suillus subaureus TaxID=48587 RepID=A0A9P7EJV5_9AGAM|nr:uncharacterized protein BJ212DRAFT_1327240 [Suillus subaureus]KAG1823943.1 hypothetical protein BJ212DRAFT_1327240 [Suillus subaureus]